MKTAICPINKRTYEAATFEQDDYFEFIKNSMMCPRCSQPAFFRGVTQNGREACFGARHTEGCDMATSEHDDMQEIENESQATAQRIVVDFNAAGGIDHLLQSLMESDEFRRSAGTIEVPGHGELTIADLFVNFADVTENHIGCYHGFWGLIPDARVSGNTMWLNSGGPDSTCANIDQSNFETIYQRFDIQNAAEISGAHILVFGELKKGKNSNKKFVLVNDPCNFTVYLPEKKTQAAVAKYVDNRSTRSISGPLGKIEIKPDNTLCESDYRDLSVVIASITDVNLELSQFINNNVSIDDAERSNINFMLDQIHDLSFRAGLLQRSLTSE